MVSPQSVSSVSEGWLSSVFGCVLDVTELSKLKANFCFLR